MAIAGRVYKRFDVAYAGQCLRVAKQAWTWLGEFPDVAFRNPAGVGTGEYGDRNCHDERLWAAAELWRTTGEEPYQRYFLEHYAEFRERIGAVGPQSWGSVSNLALWTYVLGGRKDAAAVNAIRGTSLAAADQNVEPWPGLLSGGPNRGRQDAAMRKLPAELPPARMYLDEQEAYSANEVAINWNAPLVFLLAATLPSK